MKRTPSNSSSISPANQSKTNEIRVSWTAVLFSFTISAASVIARVTHRFLPYFDRAVFDPSHAPSVGSDRSAWSRSLLIGSSFDWSRFSKLESVVLLAETKLDEVVYIFGGQRTKADIPSCFVGPASRVCLPPQRFALDPSSSGNQNVSGGSGPLAV